MTSAVPIALVAYLVGVEVETKVAEAINPRHYEDGFHSTATAGAVGAGAAAARILGLDSRTHGGCAGHRRVSGRRPA